MPGGRLVVGACALLFAVAPAFTVSGPSTRAGAEVTIAKGLYTGGLETGLVDVPPFLGDQAPIAFRRVRGAGTSMVRIIVFWRFVAPDGEQPTRPAGFNPADHTDSAYHWANIDRQVQLAVANGLKPILGLQLAPRWAERGDEGRAGTRDPDPAEFAAFARAAARRYGGRVAGLPRVRYWQAWNEPNISLFLTPQSPVLYRRMVNAFADAVHGVYADNLVIAGGMSSFGFEGVAVAPMRFMRELLCVSKGPPIQPTCADQIKFDVWAHHPYTAGGPTRKAQNPDDASLGDLPQMRGILAAAVAAGRVASRYRVRFWVTEFSWDSSPPDPIAVPAKLHARWVAEALYRMWRAGVSQVTWFQLRDDPLRTSEFQSGLYLNSGANFARDRAKLAHRAFRLPFVALRERGAILVWGRLPFGNRGVVVVEQSAGKKWRPVAKVAADRYGIFTKRLSGRLTGTMRARLVRGGETSVPFALKVPPDMNVWPFGCGGILPCS